MTAPERLGGRLPLLKPAQLDDQQQAVYEQLQRLVVPESEQAGYVAQLADGRLIGPFNAMLRAPDLTAGFGGWVSAIAQAGIAEDVRQVVILTVGAAWRADYEMYAHTAAARTAGLPDAAIEAILTGTSPSGLTAEASLAHDLVRTLLETRDVPDLIYGECLRVFGETATIAILSLVGQYQLVSSLLVCFRVPAVTTDQRESTDAR